jgi:hypothetical protein
MKNNTEVIPRVWETRIKAFVLQEVRHFHRDSAECTSQHIQEGMDGIFGTRYHATIWKLLLGEVSYEN